MLRPSIFNDNLFDDFIELHGDRLYKDDGSIVGGLAMFNNIPCTVIGHLKRTNFRGKSTL